MREKISIYVEGLFSDAALTIRNAEVQQEILQHALDRYDDLIAAGKSEQEAYDEAVGGIGDVSELYEHKQAAEKPKKRDFPAPPTPDAVSTAPQTGRKKKLPGWAIALICVGVAAAILALNFAGQAAFGVLRAGGRYIYDNANKYETLDRSGFGSAEDPVAASELLTGIDEIEIHWLTGDVYLVESDTDGVTFQEDYTGSNEDYRMRYKVSNGKLTIQPCRSRFFQQHGSAAEGADCFPAQRVHTEKHHSRNGLGQCGTDGRQRGHARCQHYKRRDYRPRTSGQRI